MRHRVWSRRVSSQWVPGTTREILVWFCWVALHPWHHRRNYTLYECLSPSVYYKNHRAPTSPRRSENRPEQSVKRSAGKPVMTTSGSIWLSVGREMAQRETETTVGNWKALQDYCRWVFVFHSWFSLLFFFFLSSNRAKERVAWLSVQRGHPTAGNESMQIQQRRNMTDWHTCKGWIKWLQSFFF